MGSCCGRLHGGISPFSPPGASGVDFRLLLRWFCCVGEEVLSASSITVSKSLGDDGGEGFSTSKPKWRQSVEILFCRTP